MTTRALANLTVEQLQNEDTWLRVYDALVVKLKLKPKRNPKVMR